MPPHAFLRFPPVLVELSQRFIWPFDMSVCQTTHMVVQESTHPRSPLAVDRGVIGRRLPMLRTAAGRCYLAFCTPADRARVLQQIAQLGNPEDSFDLAAPALQRMLGETTERGYATRYHERYIPNTSSIAVPIFSGQVLVGAMAVIWITKAMTLAEAVDQFLASMREAAQRISQRLTPRARPHHSRAITESSQAQLSGGTAGSGTRTPRAIDIGTQVPHGALRAFVMGQRGATRGLKQYAELTGEKRGLIITADDVLAQAGALVSVFVANPEFQGQTKERLSSSDAQRLVEKALADPFDHWLTAQPKSASALLEFVIERAEERLKRRKDKEVARASATRKLRLPGKLADCSGSAMDGTELFLVEGDSAGGSAKQARNRKTQAILPLRGKILNVASATGDKLMGNKELADLMLALGVQGGSKYRDEDLRRRRRAHRQPMPEMIRNGRLYLALPPLYRISHGGKAVYARDPEHRDELLATEFKNKKPEISRFKGLGEMMPAQALEAADL
eukprot:gene35285-47415_t